MVKIKLRALFRALLAKETSKILDWENRIKKREIETSKNYKKKTKFRYLRNLGKRKRYKRTDNKIKSKRVCVLFENNIGNKYIFEILEYAYGEKGRKERERGDSLSALKVSVRETFSLRYLAPFVCTYQFPISIFTTYSHVVKLGKECKVNVTFALCARPGTGVSTPRVVHGSKFAEFKARGSDAGPRKTNARRIGGGKNRRISRFDCDISIFRKVSKKRAEFEILSRNN